MKWYVLGDLAENYQFLVQDEIQSYHWSKEYCTLHPLVGAKNTALYTHLLYILLMVMEIFNTILFVSSLIITTTIQTLFIKYKQSLLITLKKTFQSGPFGRVSTLVRQNASANSLQRPLHDQILSYQSMLDLCVREIQSITFFGVNQEEMVNIHADLEDRFAKSKTAWNEE